MPGPRLGPPTSRFPIWVRAKASAPDASSVGGSVTYGLGSEKRLAQVIGPTMPSTSRWRRVWNNLTAAAVAGPY
jgi:hypothetical protein